MPRQGRMTAAQKQHFEEHAPAYMLTLPNLAQHQILKAETLVLDIGFGMGDALIETAEQKPEWQFLGVEVHLPGIGAVCRAAHHKALTNIKMVEGDVFDVLDTMAAPCLDRVNIFFPDPWQKKRHYKRRLIQNPFLALIASKMKSGALLHVATDWADYAEQIDALLKAHPDFTELATADTIVRPQTKFERRGIRLGHTICDFRYIRTG